MTFSIFGCKIYAIGIFILYIGGFAMKFKKIRTKMLALILPVIIIALASLTIISALSCTSMLSVQIGEKINASLSAESAARGACSLTHP